MKDSWRGMMERITQLTRSGRLREATEAIQRALCAAPAPQPSPSPAPAFDPHIVDVESRVVDDAPAAVAEAPSAPLHGEPEVRIDGYFTPEAEPLREEPAPPTRPGRMSAGSFTNAAGTRAYKLFVPSGLHDRPWPLVVMLHGCKQNPDDFAAGTRMNELAQRHGVVVLYPGQSQAANQMHCWNWFKQGDQQHGLGEPSIIAGMTERIIQTHAIDPDRVYVAGLSAGGAMAAVMAATYPDLYAAVGVHSGLPHAAANSLPSALSAMRHGPPRRSAARSRRPLPTIVFHGDHDTTVHPHNGDELIAQARWSAAGSDASVPPGPMDVERAEVPGGRSYTRTLHRDESGRIDAEHWLVHGAGHAWAGGSSSGSYTDPLGPDASREMMRFFLDHPKRE